MGFGIDGRARSRKAKTGVRALFGKAPDAVEVGDRLARLAKRILRGHIIDSSAKRITLDLHPHAAPASIVVLPSGELEIRAETSAVGPSYHVQVVDQIGAVLEELDFDWTEPTLDAEEAGQAMTAWLAGELRRDGQVRVGMPGDRSFRIDAPVLTALGPRDAAWRDAVLADPRRGADAFAWWNDELGHERRARALLAMWHEVPWRPPLDDDERAVMEQVDTDLRAARRADAALELPWADWAALLDHLDSDANHVPKILARAAGAKPTIGYRRFPMDVELSGGWTLELPGSFVGTWDEGEERYVATDGERSIEFTSLTATGETDSDRLLAVAPENHPVIERLVDAARRGRAEAHDDAGVRVVHGLMTVAPHVAIVTCRGDEAWALATWRSLRR